MEFPPPVNPNQQRRWVSGLALILVGGLAGLRGDTVTLRNGTTLEGIVTMQTETKLVLKQGGKTRYIRMDEVESVAKSERSDPPSRVLSNSARPPPQAPAQPAINLDALYVEHANRVINATVKVYATVSMPDVRKPWAKLAPREETGSGFVIVGNRILTNAHFVEYATDIQIRASQAGTKIPAHLVAIDTCRDLAVLKLDNDKFFSTHAALVPITLIPGMRDVLQVYGYADESANVMVSRPAATTVDYTAYDSRGSGLMIRINSQIAASVSGGPVAQGYGNVLGIACCRPMGDWTYSYVIPCSEIDQFLDEVSKGLLPEKPMVYDQLQKLENPALRNYVGVDDTQHGLVVTSIAHKKGSPLLDWDVITKVGASPVDDQGTVPFIENRIDYGYALHMFAVPDIDSYVIRAGKIVHLRIPITLRHEMLIADAKGMAPSYFVFGPLVFSTVTAQLVSFISSSDQLEALLGIRASPLVTRRTEAPSFPGEQLVFVPAPFFPHKLARGYGDPTFTVFKAVNGIPIRNLNHLVQVIRDAKDEFITIEFFEKYSEILVFSRAEMIAATDDILNDNNVRSQGTPDTMAVWNVK